jgi:hypothetical protein
MKTILKPLLLVVVKIYNQLKILLWITKCQLQSKNINKKKAKKWNISRPTINTCETHRHTEVCYKKIQEYFK